MSEHCLSSSDNVRCAYSKKCKSCVAGDLFYIKRISVHAYYKHLYPSLAQPRVPIHKDQQLSSKSLWHLKRMTLDVYLIIYGFPLLATLRMSSRIRKRRPNFFKQIWLLKFTAVYLLCFNVMYPIALNVPFLSVNWALTRDLQDPQLALYRRRLFTDLPEVFKYRYLQDKELRRFDGTLPEEEPDEVAVDNYR
mmetsp:Transcript_20119/g.37400  ORF Transcript_20119/g.37400 Transcript_20119/m.37400 type:complete len:193 (-) Transcript_20119:1740-2318(-)